MDTPCEQEYAQNTVKLTYIDSGATGDPYTGLDRGACPVRAGRRVIDQRWHKGTTELERLKYAYTRTNNRTERDNTVATTGQDGEYDGACPGGTGDGLYRLDNMGRGDFNNGTLDKEFEQDWGYDALGNWNNFKQDDDGTGWDLNQTRAHTKANEIEEIDSDSSVVSHDPAGNLTKSPRPGNWSETFDYTWDAWNRLVRVRFGGRLTVASFRYSGQHKRITKTASGITRHFYYSIDWQILEERLDEETEPLRQYVWNPNPDRMDDLVLRDEGAEGSGSSSSGTQQRLYALNDLMNVTAIVDDDGNVVERYGYTPFGESRVMDAGFGPRTSSDFDWELRYKTYPLDLESGLYQVRFRYLHPGLGRWMSRDPIGDKGGLNLYGFVGNDPVSRFDSFGLFLESIEFDGESYSVKSEYFSGKFSKDGGGNVNARIEVDENFFGGFIGGFMVNVSANLSVFATDMKKDECIPTDVPFDAQLHSPKIELLKPSFSVNGSIEWRFFTGDFTFSLSKHGFLYLVNQYVLQLNGDIETLWWGEEECTCFRFRGSLGAVAELTINKPGLAASVLTGVALVKVAAALSAGSYAGAARGLLGPVLRPAPI